jgi:hypothetical protein
MRVREAKDFLVDRIKQQAMLEEVPLSDVEIDMLYFTEQGGLSEKIQKAAEEFDQLYDMAEYERKISRLMKHAYAEIKKQDPAAKAIWDSAIRCLRKGDHYILVMCGGVQPIVVAVVVGLILLSLAFFAGLNWFTNRFPPPSPHVLLGVFVGAIVLALLFPRTFGKMFNWIADRTFLRFFRSGEEKEE